MKRIVAGVLLCATTGMVHADVTVLDSDSIAAKVGHQVKAGEKRGVPLKLASPGPRSGEINLTDQSGLEYFINTNVTFSTTSSASGAASEASYVGPVAATTSAGGTTASTLNDAFDGYGALCLSFDGGTGACNSGGGPKSPVGVATYIMYNQNGAATSDCGGRQVIYNTQAINGIDVSRRVYVPTDDSFARWVNIFTNTTGAPVSFHAVASNNLGSDGNTVVVTSSSGDAIATGADNWVTTFQDYSGTTSSDPRLGHVLKGPGSSVGLASVNIADGENNPFWSYPLTLAPGQTGIIMTFVTGQPSKAAAASQAARLTALPATALTCLSTTNQGQLLNFQLGGNGGPAPTAVDLPSMSRLGAVLLIIGLALIPLYLRRRRNSSR
ncbi:hypothetical protein [Dokdonella sp.]|uniref:hypothetical protein n=1 Tax=Dokdonella sp. TaxID=2291710 RepID=UPI003C457E11